MCDGKIVLTPQTILEQPFKVDARGYRMQEVDKFLDIVIRDYQVYDIELKRLKKENKIMNDENLQLKQELRNLRLSIDTLKKEEKGITNVDLLRRISQLENIVLGREEN
ncbi:MAG: cell division regulator GpsB [bacterium]|nr:cell division regulator GpsB [bacterium]